MKFHRFLDREAVAAAFEALGFATPDEATRFRNVDRLYRHLLQRTGGDGTGPEFRDLPQRFLEAQHLASKFEGAGRDLVGLHDPATAMLRHLAAPAIQAPAGSGVLDEEAVRYVRPDSIQSSQSPAAYLTWLYNLAKTEITPALPPFGLDRRRPDLQHLVLSRDHLDVEITTLRLANEILTAQLVDNGIAGDEAALIEAMKTERHPFAMPFDEDNATVREALAAMGGLSLNAVAERGREDAFAPGAGDYTLVANPADRLRLYGEHVAMLSEHPDSDGTLYSVWYGLPEGVGNAEMQHADVFTIASGLSFQEMEALVGDDRAVVGEDGRAYPGAYIDFSGAGWWEIRLVEKADGRYRTEGRSSPEGDWRTLVVRQHQLQNVVIRLQRRTGLAFHRLDWLLQAAFHGHETDNRWTLLGNGTALNVLAHYAEWHARHGVGPDEFAGLLRRINYYHREGSGETTLMASLFGGDAPEVTRRVREEEPDAVTVGELEGEGDAGRLGAVLRRGLRLSRADWDAVLAATGAVDDDPFDGLLLGKLYRLSHLFRLTGWDAIEGVELVRKVDPALLDTLATSELCNDVLRALDTVSWLAEWMREAAFTPFEAMTALTAPAAAVVYPNQDIVNWVLELQQGVEGALVGESDFIPYTEWRKEDGDPVVIRTDSWVAELKTAGVLDDEDRGLMVTGERGALAAAVTGVLEKNAVDLDDPGQAERADELVGRLVARHGEQGSILAAHVARQGEGLDEGAVPALLRWMGSGAYEALTVLVDWDADQDPADDKGLRLLFDIHRHALVVGRLGMNVPEVELAADNPSWIAQGMEAPLTLKQIYLLSRFKGLQDAQMSANDWLAYFAKVAGDDTGGDQEENHEWLARLLGWPAGEIALLAVGPGIGIEDGRVATVEQADFLARRIALCRDAALGAGELIALESANGDEPDWRAARAAALIGLGRFEDGTHVPAAQGEVDEELRDALVGLYMTRVAAADEELKEHIRTDEHLYEYLLLDVKVSKEVPTTRLLEATGSVQLYINRALENVEDAGFEDRAGFAQRWETGQQYRLWEANEKLVLYPSNYIEPELRQGKSDLFRTFEQNLADGDINSDTVERAINGYVTALQRLSELRADGFFVSPGIETTTYWFTARALWEKHGYYYRRLEVDPLRLEDGTPHALAWDPWTKATLPIAAEHVSTVMPGFAWNRLFLFWFEVEVQTVTADDGTISTHYRLRPRYSRQNLDGTFTDPWSPSLGEDVDLEITKEIPNDDAGNPDPGAYSPVLYLPYYDADQDRIVFIFTPFPSEVGARDKAFVWSLSGSTSRNEIRYEGIAFRGGDSLGDYDSVPHALNMLPGGEYTFVPTDTTSWLRGEYNGARLDITNFNVRVGPAGDSSFRVQWSPPASEEDTHFRGNVEGDVSLVEVEVAVLIGGEPHATQRVADSLPSGHDGPVPLRPADLVVDIPADWVAEGYFYVRTMATLIRGDTGLESSFNRSLYHRYIYVTDETNVNSLFRGTREAGREAERYLLYRDEDRGVYAASLFSSGIGEIANRMHPGFDVRLFFALENQHPPERGVDNFLDQAGDKYGAVQEPRPLGQLDFSGPFGRYAWELFFHMPLTIAARYNAVGKHEEARGWLHTIYDPRADAGEEWGVLPLLPDRGRASSFAIADPDRIAAENPAHYRLATLRHYLRTMTDQGDAQYREETAESMRRARMWYVSAKNLFLDVSGAAFAQSTRSDWKDPTLGAAAEEDFRPPYNAEMRAAFETLEERLANLRHWRSIDGEPLTVPLVASPVEPRELQTAALAAAGGGAGEAPQQIALPYTYETALAKAKEAVATLMHFGELLTRGLYRSDALALEELQAAHAHHIAQNLEEAGQRSLIASMEMEKAALGKEKEEADAYLEGYGRFADELMNTSEEAGHAMFGIKGTMHAAAVLSNGIAGGLSLLPNIFGFAVGGSKLEAVPDSAADGAEQNAEWFGTMGEALLHRGEVYRRRQENEMERDATRKVVERIGKEIERLEFDIGEEKGTLEELERKSANAQALIAFHRGRVTNREFGEWYVARVASLYDSAYDVTVRFCRLAERAYRIETGLEDTFIRPAWDSAHRGLLAGQSLMLDLQRMDFTFMERYRPPAEGRRSIALGALDPRALRTLKRSGRALFTIDEAVFDEDWPDEYERRIKSLRVFVAGLGADEPLNARLRLVGHRVLFGRDGSAAGAAWNVFGQQQISLLGAETDTCAMTASNGRFGPFERCGVTSTWMLSIPGAVEELETRRRRSGRTALLDKLEDVVLDVRYTARVGNAKRLAGKR